jgi:hypothetical protein
VRQIVPAGTSRGPYPFLPHGERPRTDRGGHRDAPVDAPSRRVRPWSGGNSSTRKRPFGNGGSWPGIACRGRRVSGRSTKTTANRWSNRQRGCLRTTRSCTSTASRPDLHVTHSAKRSCSTLAGVPRSRYEHQSRHRFQRGAPRLSSPAGIPAQVHQPSQPALRRPSSQCWNTASSRKGRKERAACSEVKPGIRARNCSSASRASSNLPS